MFPFCESFYLGYLSHLPAVPKLNTALPKAGSKVVRKKFAKPFSCSTTQEGIEFVHIVFVVDGFS